MFSKDIWSTLPSPRGAQFVGSLICMSVEPFQKYCIRSKSCLIVASCIITTCSWHLRRNMPYSDPFTVSCEMKNVVKTPSEFGDRGERAEKEACLHKSVAVTCNFTKQQFVPDPQPETRRIWVNFLFFFGSQETYKALGRWCPSGKHFLES